MTSAGFWGMLPAVEHDPDETPPVLEYSKPDKPVHNVYAGLTVAAGFACSFVIVFVVGAVCSFQAYQAYGDKAPPKWYRAVALAVAMGGIAALVVIGVGRARGRLRGFGLGLLVGFRCAALIR